MFFSIIKILLIVICCILGFILLLLFYFLFTPIRFKTRIDFDKMHARITLLDILHLYRFGMIKEDGIEVEIRLLFGLIKPKIGKDTSKSNKDEKANSKEINSSENVTTTDTGELESKSKKSEKDLPKDSSPKKSSNKIDQFKLYYKEFKDKRNRRAVKFALKKLLALVKKLLFNKVYCDVNFGLKDPATTGYIVGALATLPIIYDPGVRIVPDFTTDKNYISGNAKISGRLYPIKLITTLISIYNNRDVKRVIHHVRKLSKG